MKKLVLNRNQSLDVLAKRYVWWETIDWSYAHPEIFLANVMNLGNWNDIQKLRQLISDTILKIALQKAPAGSFSPRSWDYWHVKFALPISPIPKRDL